MDNDSFDFCNKAYLEELEKEAQMQTINQLKSLKKKMTSEDYKDYLDRLKAFTRCEVERRAGIETVSYCFDIVDGNQVLQLEKRIFTTVFNLAPAVLHPTYTITSTNPNNCELDSPEFFYSDFVKEFLNIFKEQGFENKYDLQNLQETFKFFKTEKFNIEQHLIFPELELVFDKNENVVIANAYQGERTIFEDVEFQNVEKECKTLNTPKIQTKVVPKLQKYGLHH